METLCLIYLSSSSLPNSSACYVRGHTYRIWCQKRQIMCRASTCRYIPGNPAATVQPKRTVIIYVDPSGCLNYARNASYSWNSSGAEWHKDGLQTLVVTSCLSPGTELSVHTNTVQNLTPRAVNQYNDDCETCMDHMFRVPTSPEVLVL